MGADIKSLRSRIRSVDSTLHLTKAMGLVAASKIRRATRTMNQSREYASAMDDVVSVLSSSPECARTPYMQPKGEGTRLIVIAGDRGLAGGYNSNMFKKVEEISAGKDYVVLPIGKKAVEYFKRRNREIVSEAFGTIADISVSDCFEISSLLCRLFRDGEYGHIELCYTEFVSMLSQRPQSRSILPLSALTRGDADPAARRNLIVYEPSAEEVFNSIVPEYLAGLVYGAVCDSVASELAARRTAMEAATDNAEEMIEKLNLYYNRARQASITQEITEIVGGAEGLTG